MRPFELALVIGFGIAGVVGLIILSTYQGGGRSEPPPANAISGAVTIWGTLPAAGVNDVIATIAATNDTFRNVRYRQVAPDAFGNELIRALADNQQPDLVLLPHELLMTYRNRFVPFSYQQFPLREFRDRYVDGTEIFALPEGVYGVPLFVDPLMMYWNRNVLTSAGFLQPPQTWEELLATYFPALIVRSQSRDIRRAVVAMGAVRNVTNAAPIIYSLFLQGGSQGVNVRDGQVQLLLDSRQAGGGRPFFNAVEFYTRFSTFNNVNYTWNASLPNDREQFLREDLMFYFGFGSEARELERRNPNLNFDIAEFPQGAEATLRRTYGRFYSLMVLQRARNPQAAYTVLSILAEDRQVQQMAAYYNFAPVRRSLLQGGSTDLYGRMIFRSAPIAYGWLSPAPAPLATALATMVEDITSERKSVSAAVADGLERIRGAY